MGIRTALSRRRSRRHARALLLPDFYAPGQSISQRAPGGYGCRKQPRRTIYERNWVVPGLCYRTSADNLLTTTVATPYSSVSRKAARPFGPNAEGMAVAPAR